MSNLLKGFAVAVDDTEKRVIDYNDVITQKLMEIRASLKQDGVFESGFNEGLSAVNVSQVLDEGNQIIGESIAEAPSETEEQVIANKEKLIADAKAEADGIVKQANEDAVFIIAEAKAEAQQIREEAKKSGYAEGTAAANSNVEKKLKEAENALKEKEQLLISEYEKKKDELEPALVETILKIFAEITKAVSIDKKDMILTLVNNVMAGGEASRNFVIRVCNEDAQFLKENREKIINAVRKDIHLEIVTDPSMRRNECFIDTDTGVYDCSLDIQMENLITDIKILSCTGE